MGVRLCDILRWCVSEVSISGLCSAMIYMYTLYSIQYIPSCMSNKQTTGWHKAETNECQALVETNECQALVETNECQALVDHLR